MRREATMWKILSHCVATEHASKTPMRKRQKWNSMRGDASLWCYILSHRNNNLWCKCWCEMSKNKTLDVVMLRWETRKNKNHQSLCVCVVDVFWCIYIFLSCLSFCLWCNDVVKMCENNSEERLLICFRWSRCKA